MNKGILLGLSCACSVAALAACGSDTNGSGGSGGTSSSSSSATTATSSSGTGGSTTTSSSSGTGGSGPVGPGATLKCDSSGKNAFETYGAAGFVAVNKAIVAKTLAEVMTNGTTNLGDSFTKVGSGNPPSTTDDLPTFEGKLAAFLVFAYGGPTSITYSDNKMYSGLQDMVAAHTGLNITAAQYTYFVTSIVVPALTDSGVKHGAGGAADPDDVGSCFAPVVLDQAFIATIVGH